MPPSRMWSKNLPLGTRAMSKTEIDLPLQSLKLPWQNKGDPQVILLPATNVANVAFFRT